MAYNYESELSEAFGQLLKIETDYNVIINIGKEPNFKEFHAHSCILRCRSEHFNKLLSAENIEIKDGKYIINKPNISPRVFNAILKYLYTGKIDIANEAGSDLLNFIFASDELTPTSLKEFCLDEICFKPDILFNSDKFTQLSATLLEIILKRDDLNLEEIKIWENLIKWGLAQDPILNKNVFKLNDDGVNTLKRILCKFIPLIRFDDISSRDYSNKVIPYEKILPEELRDDILLKSLMISDYNQTYTSRRSKYSKYSKCNINDIDSIIINCEHLTLFANWIDRKEGNFKYINDIPYKFNLLYRANRDGNTAEMFHAKCDNKGATLVVVKVKNSEQIVGGYTPLSWQSGLTDKSTKDSFIFSLYGTTFQNAKVAYSYDDGYSICCISECGPFFGGSDLYLNHCNGPDFWCAMKPFSYPSLGLPWKVIADDYEVFQVIKK